MTPTELAYLANRYACPDIATILHQQQRIRTLRPAQRKPLKPQPIPQTLADILTRQNRVRRLRPAIPRTQRWPSWVCR